MHQVSRLRLTASRHFSPSAGEAHPGLMVPHICPRLADVTRPHQEGETQLWQKRYYEHNVRSYEKLVENLRCMHRNPAKRGLPEKPEDWKWSSYRHYAFAEVGLVDIESQWTADRREGRVPKLSLAR